MAGYKEPATCSSHFDYDEEEALPVPEFFRLYKNKLPMLAIIVDGKYGLTRYDSFDCYQVVRIHCYTSQPRVLCIKESNARSMESKFISIPVKTDVRFRVIKSRKNVTDPLPLHTILERYAVPLLVRPEPSDNQLTVKVRSQPYRIEDIGNILIMDKYVDHYLKQNCLDGKEIKMNRVACMLCLSDEITVAPIKGFSNKSAKEFEKFRHELDKQASINPKQYDKTDGEPNWTDYQLDPQVRIGSGPTFPVHINPTEALQMIQMLLAEPLPALPPSEQSTRKPPSPPSEKKSTRKPPSPPSEKTSTRKRLSSPPRKSTRLPPSPPLERSASKPMVPPPGKSTRKPSSPPSRKSTGISPRSVPKPKPLSPGYFKLLSESYHEKTNIIDSAYCIDPEQSVHSAQAYPDSHIPSLDDKGSAKLDQTIDDEDNGDYEEVEDAMFTGPAVPPRPSMSDPHSDTSPQLLTPPVCGKNISATHTFDVKPLPKRRTRHNIETKSGITIIRGRKTIVKIEEKPTDLELHSACVSGKQDGYSNTHIGRAVVRPQQQPPRGDTYDDALSESDQTEKGQKPEPNKKLSEQEDDSDDLYIEMESVPIPPLPLHRQPITPARNTETIPTVPSDISDTMNSPAREDVNTFPGVKDLSIDEVATVLTKLNLHQFTNVFRKNCIDGEILTELTVDDLIVELKLTKLEAIRLHKYVNKGHIPM